MSPRRPSRLFNGALCDVTFHRRSRTGLHSVAGFHGQVVACSEETENDKEDISSEIYPKSEENVFEFGD